MGVVWQVVGSRLVSAVQGAGGWTRSFTAQYGEHMSSLRGTLMGDWLMPPQVQPHLLSMAGQSRPAWLWL